MSTEKIVIKGVTVDGKRFRPSDWAQRLATAVGTISSSRRIIFHPKVSLAMIDDVNCVVLDASLEQDEPLIFTFLVKFAQDNKLQMEHVAEVPAEPNTANVE